MNTNMDDQLRNEGISSAHAQSFLEVARSQDCIILTRTPGKACLGPLEDGYDAKGFHIKGKSCNWGPMAGFICAEPFFNKSGADGAQSNLNAHVSSLTQDFERLRNSQYKGPPVYAGLVQLEITEARRAWLLANKYIDHKIDQILVEGESVIPGSLQLRVKWVLQRNLKTGRWSLYYKNPSGLPALQNPVGFETFKARIDQVSATAPQLPSRFADYKPVLALTNPYPPYTGADAFKNAVTGDFDLFAVWPRKEKEGDYLVRVGGMTPDTSKKQIYAAEANNSIGSVAGNISDGVYMIGQLLNSVMASKTGFAKVNRIFHSDEGGRPGIDAIDASVAFTPEGKSYLFPDNSPAFPPFVVEHAKDRAIFLNNGWVTPLKSALPAAQWAELEKSIRWQSAVAGT